MSHLFSCLRVDAHAKRAHNTLNIYDRTPSLLTRIVVCESCAVWHGNLRSSLNQSSPSQYPPALLSSLTYLPCSWSPADHRRIAFPPRPQLRLPWAGADSVELLQMLDQGAPSRANTAHNTSENVTQNESTTSRNERLSASEELLRFVDEVFSDKHVACFALSSRLLASALSGGHFTASVERKKFYRFSSGIEGRVSILGSRSGCMSSSREPSRRDVPNQVWRAPS